MLFPSHPLTFLSLYYIKGCCHCLSSISVSNNAYFDVNLYINCFHLHF